jgi:hypothetical protein
MRMHVCCGFLTLVMAAAALADGVPSSAAEYSGAQAKHPWGDENARLRCWFKAPARLEQWMPLEAELKESAAAKSRPTHVR